MYKLKDIKESGFTLIELLVSIALFSVVLTVTLGSIMTIADSNKKSRSLMSITNNLNFAVESMTRSFKAGKVSSASGFVYSGPCFFTEERDYLGDTFDTREVRYCYDENADGRGFITKEVGGDIVELTSSDVDIDVLKFINSSFDDGQPMLTIVMSGTVKVSEKVSSSFSIQTAVSQRVLDVN